MGDAIGTLVGENLSKIVHLTKNLPNVLERLQDYDVLTSEELYLLDCCENDMERIELLYAFIAEKPLSNFDLLLYVLRDTDNHSLAKFLEESLKNGSTGLPLENKKTASGRNKPRSNTDALRSTLIIGGEMGIAELLADYPSLSGNWNKLPRMLNVPTPDRRSNSEIDNFVIHATYLLREWSYRLKKMATVDSLCRLLEKEDLQECTERIRRMFLRYIDTGFGFDFPGAFSIVGKISAIATALEKNPSFCLHPERLILLLNLPLETIEYTSNSNFCTFAERILTRWAAEKSDLASTDHLASLLAINGHFHTCDKISLL